MTISHYEEKKHHSPETRKQQILLAAEIVLLKEGIERFTIDQVVSHAQIAKGTVYKYYKSKDHLLSEMSVKAVEMLFTTFKGAVESGMTSLVKIQSVIKACYQFYRNYPQYYSLLNHFERADVNPEEKEKYLQTSIQLQQFIEGIIVEGKHSKEINVNVPDRYIDYIIWSCCVGMIQFIENKKDLIPNFKEINQDQLVNDFAGIITSGLK